MFLCLLNMWVFYKLMGELLKYVMIYIRFVGERSIL